MVGLDAGDTLEISVPAAANGTLTLHVESDLGTKTSARLTGGQTNYIVAARTGTFKLTLHWVPAPGHFSGTQVTFSQIPGPLNNLMELLTSYKQQGANQVVYQWAYGASDLPANNPHAGFAPGDTAAASYWPLWSDTKFFPVPRGTPAITWASKLSDAYAKLVASSSLHDVGFANLINAPFPNNKFVADLQADLASAYAAAFGANPPPPPGGNQPFPVEASPSRRSQCLNSFTTPTSCG